MSWHRGHPNRGLRAQYIAALQGGAGTMTAPQVGARVGVSGSTALQMLYALEYGGFVARERGKGRTLAWRLTGKPLPEQSAELAPTRGHAMVGLFDDTALRQALGVPAQPPAAANARIAVCEGERV